MTNKTNTIYSNPLYNNPTYLKWLKQKEQSSKKITGIVSNVSLAPSIPSQNGQASLKIKPPKNLAREKPVTESSSKTIENFVESDSSNQQDIHTASEKIKTQKIVTRQRTDSSIARGERSLQKFFNTSDKQSLSQEIEISEKENENPIQKQEKLERKKSIELRRYSGTITATTLSPKDAPPITSLGQFLTREALQPSRIDSTAQQLMEIYFFKDGAPKIVDALETCWNSFVEQKSDFNALNPRQEKKIQHTLEKYSNFHQLLARLSTYDKGIPIVCDYFKRLVSKEIAEGNIDLNKEHVNNLADCIYKRSSEKGRFFQILQLFTDYDLTDEKIDTLLRESNKITRSLCKIHLSNCLKPQIKELVDQFNSQLSKKPKKELQKSITQFLEALYSMPISSDIKDSAKIRQKAIKSRFENTCSPERLNEGIQNGLNDLLFLNGINLWILDFLPGIDDSSRILRKTIQHLASQTPDTSGHQDAGIINPIYKQFQARHQDFIQQILN